MRTRERLAEVLESLNPKIKYRGQTLMPWLISRLRSGRRPPRSWVWMIKKTSQNPRHSPHLRELLSEMVAYFETPDQP